MILLPVALLTLLGLFVVRPHFFRHVVDRTGTGKDWSDALSAAAATADRVVVNDVGFHGGQLPPDCEIQGRDKVEEFVRLIDIDANSGFHCMCDGNYRILFYKGDKGVLTLGYHHGRSLYGRV